MPTAGYRPRVFVAVTVASLAGIGWLDAVTGYELQFFIFYFLPVSLAAWNLSRAAGVLAAVLSAAVWLFADVYSGHPYSNPTLLYWNTGIRLAAFLIIAVALARLRTALTAERALRGELQVTLSEVKQLRGLLPICSTCKRIRSDAGAWEPIEQYLSSHSEAEFTHGLCPECLRKLYPEIADELLGNPKPA